MPSKWGVKIFKNCHTDEFPTLPFGHASVPIHWLCACHVVCVFCNDKKKDLCVQSMMYCRIFSSSDKTMRLSIFIHVFLFALKLLVWLRKNALMCSMQFLTSSCQQLLEFPCSIVVVFFNEKSWKIRPLLPSSLGSCLHLMLTPHESL